VAIPIPAITKSSSDTSEPEQEVSPLHAVKSSCNILSIAPGLISLVRYRWEGKNWKQFFKTLQMETVREDAEFSMLQFTLSYQDRP